MNGIFFNKSWENFARRQRGEFFGRLDRDVVWGGEGGCKRKERLDSLVAVYLEGSPLERWDGGGILGGPLRRHWLRPLRRQG